MPATATITQRDKLPDEARMAARLVERLGFKWELDLRYPTPDVNRRVQVREEKHYAPAAQVSQYAAAMARNDAFAPIVVTRDGYLIDGNTRTQAARKNKFPTIPALVLDRDYEGANEQVERRMHLLGAAFNTRNGRGIDRAEITKAVLAIGEGNDYDAARIASLLGVHAALVTGILAEERARGRARAHGVTVNGSIPATQLRKLGQARLNDQPFMDLLQLTQDAGLSSTEVGDLVKRIREAGSDAAAREIIEREREERRDQISEYRASGKSRPPTAARLRQKLGFVINYGATPKDLVEHNPTLTETHLSMLERSISILTAARDLQRTGG